MEKGGGAKKWMISLQEKTKVQKAIFSATKLPILFPFQATATWVERENYRIQS